jgi:glutathione S-transferase
MLKLAGFAISNYYNKVKLALLEKNVPFEEELNWAAKDEATLACSPLGKVPFLRTDRGSLSESQVIMEYIEETYPQTPLLPADPYERARVRELIQFLELHVELVARRVYGQAFFGGTVPQDVRDATYKELTRNVAAFARLAKFSPYLAGAQFTMADCAAAVHLPLVSRASLAVWNEDVLAALPVKDYLKRVGERPTVQKVNEDRKANFELRARMQSKS